MNWEFEVLNQIQTWHNPVLDWIMVKVSALGNASWFWIVLGVCLLLFWKKNRKIGFTVLLSLVIDALITNIWLKNWIMRDRPCWVNSEVLLLVDNPADYSFPSGHSAASFAAATALFCYNKKLGICAYILAFMIAFSRLYLYVHFPTDVGVGAVIGIVCGIFGFILAKRIQIFS